MIDVCVVHSSVSTGPEKDLRPKGEFHRGGSVAEWSARRTCNPAVQGSSPALATCWICAWSSRVQFLGHASV